MNTKDKLYNYEVQPPDGVWDSIVAELDGQKRIVPMGKKPVKMFYTIFAAAACVSVLLFVATFFQNSENNADYLSINNGEHIMTVPIDDSNNNNAETTKVDEKNLAQKDVLPAKKFSDNKNNIPSKHKQYLTIAGPEGQSVNISLKAASLIDSSDNSMPTKLTWKKKVNAWREIMKKNNVALTAGNFLDIMELTETLKDN